MSKKTKPKGFIKGGYGFMIAKGRRSILVMNMTTLVKVYYGKPQSVISTYDLKIWADGWLAGHNKNGWGTLL